MFNLKQVLGVLLLLGGLLSTHAESGGTVSVIWHANASEPGGWWRPLHGPPQNWYYTSPVSGSWVVYSVGGVDGLCAFPYIHRTSNWGRLEINTQSINTTTSTGTLWDPAPSTTYNGLWRQDYNPQYYIIRGTFTSGPYPGGSPEHPGGGGCGNRSIELIWNMGGGTYSYDLVTVPAGAYGFDLIVYPSQRLAWIASAWMTSTPSPISVTEYAAAPRLPYWSDDHVGYTAW